MSHLLLISDYDFIILSHDYPTLNVGQHKVESRFGRPSNKFIIGLCLISGPHKKGRN